MTGFELPEPAEQTLRIEDDDGFVTEWQWPSDRLVLANSDFIALFEAQHDAMRRQRDV